MITKLFIYTPKSGKSPIFGDFARDETPIWKVVLENQSVVLIGQMAMIPLIPEDEHQTWRHRQNYRRFAREAAESFDGICVDEKGGVYIVVPQKHAFTCIDMAKDLCRFVAPKGSCHYLDYDSMVKKMWLDKTATMTPGGGISPLGVDRECVHAEWTVNAKGHVGFRVSEYRSWEEAELGHGESERTFGWAAYPEDETPRTQIVTDAGRPIQVFQAGAKLKGSEIECAAS